MWDGDQRCLLVEENVEITTHATYLDTDDPPGCGV